MKEIMYKIGGQILSFGKKTKFTPLIKYVDPLTSYLTKNYQNGQLFDYEEILKDVYLNTHFVEKDLRKTLKSMEGKTVEIIRIASKRSGIKEGDKIKFLEIINKKIPLI